MDGTMLFRHILPIWRDALPDRLASQVEAFLKARGDTVIAELDRRLGMAMPTPAEMYVIQLPSGKLRLLIQSEVDDLAREQVGQEAWDAAITDPLPGADLKGDIARAAAQAMEGEYLGLASDVPLLRLPGADVHLADDFSMQRFLGVMRPDLADKLRDAHAAPIVRKYEPIDLYAPITVERPRPGPTHSELLWRSKQYTRRLRAAENALFHQKEIERLQAEIPGHPHSKEWLRGEIKYHRKVLRASEKILLQQERLPRRRS